jgi:hypothetical protein
MLSHTTLILLLATISSVFGAVPSIVRRAITADNPTGVHIGYELNWYNPANGKFGASLTFSEMAPAATPTLFSVKFYFGAQTTTILDYWGDWKITHYQSGAFHMVPGAVPAGAAANKRTYQFNGMYVVTPEANSTFAQPVAMSLLHGVNYEDRETAFQRDDVDTPPIPAGLPTEPFGAFLRDVAKPPPSGDVGPAAAGASTNQKSSDGSGLSSNLPVIIGAIGGIVIIGAAVAVFLAVRRHKKAAPNSNYATLGTPPMNARKGSHGHVARDAVMPHVEHTHEMAIVASDAPQYMPSHSDYYDENGYVITEQTADDQMAFVEQYAPQPGYHYAEVDEVEGDDYNLHQHMVTAAQIAKESQNGYYQAGEYGQTGNGNGDFFFAQDMDRSETSQAVAIDHAFVTQAIGYHEAQIEQRIQQDMMDNGAPSPMLTLTHADGASAEQLYLQEEDYIAYEASHYDAQPVARKDSGKKVAPGKNYI